MQMTNKIKLKIKPKDSKIATWLMNYISSTKARKEKEK